MYKFWAIVRLVLGLALFVYLGGFLLGIFPPADIEGDAKACWFFLIGFLGTVLFVTGKIDLEPEEEGMMGFGNN